MKRLFPLMLALLPAAWCPAQQAKTVPQEILDRIVDDDPFPLPRGLTPTERLAPMPRPPLEDILRFAPPTGSVVTPAEYDVNQGILIRWGSFNSVLTELTVGITTGDPEAVVYIVVTDSSQQSSATSTLTSAGADMDQVAFITYVSDSVWIRDYGPRFIFEDGDRAIVDHTYNRPYRPNDNAFPPFLGALWGETVYHISLTHGGGNFHLFSNDDRAAFMTDLILDENPSLSEQDVIDLFRDYQNVGVTIYPGFPTNVDSTQHIDMWMLPLSDDKIIIGEYPGSASYPPKQITDSAAADFAAQGYTVYRTPGWNSGSGGYNGTHYTYTNAVIISELAFIPEFGGSYTSQDAQARAVFEAALPDHQIIQVDCSTIISYAGAVHCIVMHVPGPPFLDCNENGIPDEQDIDGGTSQDCQPNGVPDECETDCQPNGVPDDCDIDQGTSTDLNGNGVPDECEAKMPLPEDSLGGTCTQNDDCPGEARCIEGVCYVPKQRYLSISANPDNAGRPTARRVMLKAYPDPLGWVGTPQEANGLWLADVVSTPVYVDPWPDVLQVTDCEIASGQSYVIQAIAMDQDIGNEDMYSEALTLPTPTVWGDTISTCTGGACQPPNGVPNLDDILAALAFFQGIPVAPITWLDICPSNDVQVPDQVINVADIMCCIDGFQGVPYPGAGPLGCP